jgi:hypothetical protein
MYLQNVIFSYRSGTEIGRNFGARFCVSQGVLQYSSPSSRTLKSTTKSPKLTICFSSIPATDFSLEQRFMKTL